MITISKKMFIGYNVTLIITLIIGAFLFMNNRELRINNSNLSIQNASAQADLRNTNLEKDAYKMLYTSQEGDIDNYKALYKKAQSDLDNLQNQIYISKEKEKKVSRGDFKYKDLSQFAIMTTQEMNDWIAKRAPKDSPFIGQGEAFIKAGMDNHIDPKVVVAISATESGWGKSALARCKGNYFGITAYNNDPFNSAKSFNGNFDSNIFNSVAWIKENFYDKGKTSLDEMQSGKGAAYSQNGDGSANQEWIQQISNIIYLNNNIN